jgi:hypothetical protein
MVRLKLQVWRFNQWFAAGLVCGLFGNIGAGPILGQTQAQTELQPFPINSSLEFCQISGAAIAIKEQKRIAAQAGDPVAAEIYKNLVKQHSQEVQQCRALNPFKTQAIWLRLYPCDLQAGRLDQVMDRIINRGYNQVYIETFYDGLVLLPQAENKSPWRSVVEGKDLQKSDLLAIALTKAKERGLGAYAWFYTLNFGYSYGIRSDRAQTLARNAKGETTLEAEEEASKQPEVVILNSGQAFVDPYSSQAKEDLKQIVEAVLRRRPDGILFDYVRYKQGTGGNSISSNPLQLWIFGEASQQTLLARANNPKGKEIINRFLQKGTVSTADFANLSKLYSKEAEPLWQGQKSKKISANNLQAELWALAIEHSYAGVVDFLAAAIQPLVEQRLPTGAVFFPEGNLAIRNGFDSRLQPWDRFSTTEWHPMSYALCGSGDCIAAQVRKVIDTAAKLTTKPIKISPVLAGYWGRAEGNRPSLETQMQAIMKATPEVSAVSHFAFSWQEIELERSRQTCKQL